MNRQLTESKVATEYKETPLTNNQGNQLTETMTTFSHIRLAIKLKLMTSMISINVRK